MTEREIVEVMARAHWNSVEATVPPAVSWEHAEPHWRARETDHARKVLAALDAAGYVIVPKEPTEHWVNSAAITAIRASALEEAAKAAHACFWSQVGGGRIVSRQASPDEVEAAIRSLIPRPADGGDAG